MIRCQQCKHHNPPDSVYCERCGFELNREQVRKRLQRVYLVLALVMLGLVVTLVFRDKLFPGNDPKKLARYFNPDQAEILLRMHCNAGLRDELITPLIQVFLEKEYGISASGIIHPASDTLPLYVFGKHNRRVVAVRIESGSNEAGILKLQQGTCDLLFLHGYMVSNAENNPGLSGLVGSRTEQYLCSDAGVMIVHPANTIKRITREELALLSEGMIVDWKELLPDYTGPVMNFGTGLGTAPDTGTWVYSLPFRNKTLNNVDWSNRLRSVLNDSGGFSVVSFRRVGSAKMVPLLNDSNRIQYPTVEAIAALDYPFVVPVMMYHMPNNSQSMVLRFLNYAQTSGRKVAEASGFVAGRAPILRSEKALREMNPLLPENIRQRYTEATSGSRILGNRIYFWNGKPDARSMQEIGRLGEWLRKHQSEFSSFTLVSSAAGGEGFKESTLQQCFQRAARVRDYLSLYSNRDIRILAAGEVFLTQTASGATESEYVELWGKPLHAPLAPQ